MVGGLTQTQATLLAFIRRFISENGGVSPSVEEMRAELRLGNKSSVHRILKELRERGAVDWIDGGRRTVRVIGDYRDPYDPTTLAAQSTATLEALQADVRRVLHDRTVDAILAHHRAPAMDQRA